MKKILSIILFCLFLNVGLKAEDLAPSDIYYKDNISVNEINANAPSIKDVGDIPGGPGGTGPGGEEEGDGEWVGGLPAPIGDAALPISLVALSYGIYLMVKNRRKSKGTIN